MRKRLSVALYVVYPLTIISGILGYRNTTLFLLLFGIILLTD
jgi:hypothetical protein